MLQKQYDTALSLARSGEFIHVSTTGVISLRTGASHRTAFWQEYNHFPFRFIRGSLCHAYYAAGKDFRKETEEFVGLVGSATNCPMKDFKK